MRALQWVWKQVKVLIPRSGSAKVDAAPQARIPKKKIERVLDGWSCAWPNDFQGESQSYRPDRKDFPVPELVLFLFRDVLGWRYDGPWEKVRWTVYGSILGEPIVFEHRKFGFTITRPQNPKANTKRVEGQLKAAIRLVEKALESTATFQVNQGRVTIANRDHEFRNRYQFFRDLADKAYGEAKKATEAKPDDKKADLSDLMSGFNRMMGHNREGFFYATAMVDSYFSALEHRLVLLRGFSGQPMQPGELTALLAAKWNEKLTKVVTITGDHEREQLLGGLRVLKERIRNPFAHGGVENDGGSLFFHLDNIGAIPANFTRFGKSVRFSVIPIEEADYGDTCELFDKVDAIMSSGPLARPLKMIEGGFEPAFDPESLGHYFGVVSSDDKDFEAHLDHMGEAWMRHANMDY